jgi:hypothetical protein
MTAKANEADHNFKVAELKNICKAAVCIWLEFIKTSMFPEYYFIIPLLPAKSRIFR